MSFAQSNGLSEATHWGESVQGVQLGIAVTNSIFSAPVATFVIAAITNGSTNVVKLDTRFLSYLYSIILTNDAGKSYTVSNKLPLSGPSLFAELKPGDLYIESRERVQVNFPENIEPGDYTLIATRSLTLFDNGIRLVSNPLKIRIIK